MKARIRFKLVLEKNIPKERVYPEYQSKPIIIGHACVNLEKMRHKLSIFEFIKFHLLIKKKKHVECSEIV